MRVTISMKCQVNRTTKLISSPFSCGAHQIKALLFQRTDLCFLACFSKMENASLCAVLKFLYCLRHFLKLLLNWKVPHSFLILLLPCVQKLAWIGATKTSNCKTYSNGQIQIPGTRLNVQALKKHLTRCPSFHYYILVLFIFYTLFTFKTLMPS